ncbi:MAG TPA: hypothetical protein VFL97_04025 [Nitrococcus sp.]|jgi:hypothetical protein|nr:hypothetical protein [Nitrococcus sp.]
MTGTLCPATRDEIAQALAFGLQYDGRRRIHTADGLMARITADRLIEYLERSGFVVMKRPAAKAPSVPL